MELFLHNKISEEQTLWWNLYSVTGLWRLMWQYFSYIVAVSFIGGVNRSTQRKPLTFKKIQLCPL
jgi:hypothetical protein